VGGGGGPASRQTEGLGGSGFRQTNDVLPFPPLSVYIRVKSNQEPHNETLFIRELPPPHTPLSPLLITVAEPCDEDTHRQTDKSALMVSRLAVRGGGDCPLEYWLQFILFILWYSNVYFIKSTSRRLYCVFYKKCSLFSTSLVG
jgi:hypothetical protein